jgi:hypothetical protein
MKRMLAIAVGCLLALFVTASCKTAGGAAVGAGIGAIAGNAGSVLAYTGLSGGLVMESGPVELGAGSSSSDIRSSAKLTVTGKARSVRGEDRAFLSVATVGASPVARSADMCTSREERR